MSRRNLSRILYLLTMTSTSAIYAEESRSREERLADRAAIRQHVETLVAETVGANPSPQAITAPGNYALSIDTDLAISGNVFKDGYPFLHDDYPGARNTALGRLAMVSLTPYVPSPSSGTNNSALGTYALRYTTSGRNNTAAGSYAMFANTTGFGNSAFGAFAMFSNDLGYYNTAVGTSALFSNTVGREMTAVGMGALLSATDADYNTAVGAFALSSNATSILNTAVGASALLNTTGQENTAVGASALWALTTGYDNTAVGSLALRTNTSGHGNTVIGRFALGYSTTGSSNVVIGDEAGSSITTGSHNIIINNGAAAGDSGVIRIGNSNNIATYIAGISGGVVTGGSQVMVNAAGHLGTIVSSRRFKERIASIEGNSEAFDELRPVTFRYREEFSSIEENHLEFGLIAEEVAEVLPEIVVYDEAGRPLSVRYHALTPILLEELQRLRKRVATLEARERDVGELVERLERLEGSR